MLNANARADDETDDLYRLLNTTSLVDTFTLSTGISCNIPTYTRGNQRLDYIITSSCLLPFVKRVGYLAFLQQGGTVQTTSTTNRAFKSW
jgi:hypothetical protein